jgi:SulP family sulfate permease
MFTVLPESWKRRATPWREWLPRVNRETLRADGLAGLTGALVVLPQGLAYAVIAGLPPAYGLYCAMLPVILAALFGSSWHLVSGPTAAISIVVFAAVTPMAEPGTATYVAYVLTLTLMVGLIQLSIGLSGLGALLNFVSHGVVLGFTAGAGVLIAASQLPTFFGLEVARGGSLFGNLRQFVLHVAELNLHVLLIAMLTLAAAHFVRRLRPQWPNLLIAMVVGSAAAFALNRALGGPDVTGVRTIGELATVIPPLSLPSGDPDVWARLASAAFIVAVLGLTEALAISRSVAMRSGQLIQGNQEAVGQGLSNIAGAFVSGYASSGSFTRSGINYTAGARTPLGAVFSAVLLLVLLLLLSPLLAHLPYASMAAVLMLVARNLIDVEHMRAVMRTRSAETWVLLGTFAATLLLNLEFAILAGVFLSLAIYLDHSSRPDLTPAMPATEAGTYHFVRNPDRRECPQLRVVFLDGSIYFGAANHLQEQFREVDQLHGQKHLLLLCSGVNRIDLTGAEMLAREAERRRALGGGLYLQYVKEGVMQALRQGGYDRRVGDANFFPMGTHTMDQLVPRLDPAVCARCTVRAFRQCPPPPTPGPDAPGSPPPDPPAPSPPT